MKGEAGLASERRIGQHHVEPTARETAEAVIDHDVRLIPADAVKVQVHDAEPGGAVHDLPSVKSVVPQVSKLSLVHAGTMVDYVVVSRQQEASCAAGGVADGGARLRAHDVHDGLNQRTRREVLPCAGLHVLRVALQQRLIGIALHVGAKGQPILAVDELPDQPGEHSRLLDLVLGLAEYDAERAGLAGQGFEYVAVVGLQLVAVPRHQAGPTVAFGDRWRLIVRQQGVGRAAPLVHHLEEDEVGELLQVVAVGQTGVPQDVAVVPQLLADGGGGGHGFPSRSTSCLAESDLPRRGLVWRPVLAAAWDASRSTRMRSSSADAGSSLGSWGTSLPENACFEDALPQPLGTRCRLASTVASGLSAPLIAAAQTSATMRRCSARGGRGIRNIPEGQSVTY